MNLPNEPRRKFVDVGEMAIDRGVTSRGNDTTKLDVLCSALGMILKKPRSIRIGEVFNTMNGTLSTDALNYIQLDVEAPIRLYQKYYMLPVLIGRLLHFLKYLNQMALFIILLRQGNDVDALVVISLIQRSETIVIYICSDSKDHLYIIYLH